MTTITYPNSKFVFTDENGNTGTTILPESITTPSIKVSSIVDSNGSSGASGYVLSSTGDGIAWILSGGTALSGDLDMNNNSINNVGTVNCTNLNATTISGNTGNTTFANQISFSSAPLCSTQPTQANHLATKSYVDNKTTYNVYNLFLNKSQTTTVPLVIGSTGYSILSNVVSNTQGTPTSIASQPVNSTSSVCSFISNEINTTSIPISLFKLNIYGMKTTTVSTITPYYYFSLNLYRNTEIITISSSSKSSALLYNIPSLQGNMYTMSLFVPYTPTSLTDRLILELYITNPSTSTGSVTTRTYFEKDYYAYLQIQSNDILNFNFLSPSPPSIWVNNASSDLNINNYNIGSTVNLSISCPNKILSLGNKSSTINIESITSSNIYIGNTGGTIFLGKPLNLNYMINNTTTALGYNYNFNLPNIYFPTGNPARVTQTVPIIRAGVWLINIQVALVPDANSTGGTINSISLKLYKNNSETSQNYICGIQTSTPRILPTPLTSGAIEQMQCSGIFTTNSTNTLLIIHSITRSPSTLSINSFPANYAFITRIA